MPSYEEDLYLWSKQQAQLLRQAAKGDNAVTPDWLNIAEEIESLGRSQRRELSSRVTVLLQHMLKWHYQIDHRSRSWRSTIYTQRTDISDLLKDNPSLKSTLSTVVADVYNNSKEKALEETGLLMLPNDCPFTINQIFEDPLVL